MVPVALCCAHEERRRYVVALMTHLLRSVSARTLIGVHPPFPPDGRPELPPSVFLSGFGSKLPLPLLLTCGCTFRWLIVMTALKTLLMLGADPNCGKSTDGCTPLHSAQHMCASDIQGEMIRLLLRQGADPDAMRTDGSGTTPLHDAIEQGQAASMIQMLRGGANPNSATLDDGSTPLHIAIRWREGNLRVIQMLVAFGGRLDITDMNNRTPKDWAIIKSK